MIKSSNRKSPLPPRIRFSRSLPSTLEAGADFSKSEMYLTFGTEFFILSLLLLFHPSFLSPPNRLAVCRIRGKTHFWESFSKHQLVPSYHAGHDGNMLPERRDPCCRELDGRAGFFFFYAGLVSCRNVTLFVLPLSNPRPPVGSQ